MHFSLVLCATAVEFARKMPVSVPDGCLLVQAGKQLERLTGGHVLAGFHEVRSIRRGIGWI